MQNHSFFIPFGILFVALGVLNVVDPRRAFRMRMWQFKNKEALEPSDAVLVMGRVAGVMAIIVGIAVVAFGVASLGH